MVRPVMDSARPGAAFLESGPHPLQCRGRGPRDSLPESGMVWAVGGHRHGILLTPLAAEAAVAAAAGEPIPGWARNLSPVRFAGVAVA